MFTYTTGIDKIRNLTARKKVIQGGTSAGKTYAILAILIDEAIKTPNLEISVVSESIPHLRRGALKDFLKILKNTGRYINGRFNQTHLKYTFTNNSYIEFFSVEDESKLRGARRNVLYVNEANNIPYDAYLQLSIRTNRDIYIDFNPTNRFWAHTEVLQESDAQLLILNYLDNEALDDSIINMLHENRKKAETSDYWRNWWDVYGLGQIGKLEGVIFDEWYELDKIPSDARLLCYGLDFGYSNDPSTLIALYKFNDDIIVDEIFYQKELTNHDINILLKENNISGEIFADSAEPKSIAELKRYGHNIKATNKGRDSIVFGINLLKERKIFVTRRSHNIKDEFSKYIWKKDREGNNENRPIDNWNHTIDAIRYAATMKLSNKSIIRKPFKIG